VKERDDSHDQQQRDQVFLLAEKGEGLFFFHNSTKIAAEDTVNNITLVS
jgi:hypothetical protein